MATRRAACVCGSRKFKTGFTLEVFDVPVLLRSDDSIRYDDTKGWSEGWDTLQQPEVSCAKCGHLYHLVKLAKGNKKGHDRYALKDMQERPCPATPRVGG